jgi:hypothetical protein
MNVACPHDRRWRIAGEGWPAFFFDCQRCTPWAIAFFFSFVVIMNYIVVSFYLCEVVNSLDSYFARERGERRRSMPSRAASVW